MMFWKKKKAAPVIQVAETRELTGIEKAALEEEDRLRNERAQKAREERQKIEAKLTGLREQIRPQMEQIRALEMLLNPSQQYANYALQSQLAASYGGYPTGLSALSGIFGGLMGEVKH